MSKIGSLLTQQTGYKAFIPLNFPSEDLITWNQDLILLLSQADQAIGRLNAIDQLIPDVDFFILMYVRKEASLSTQIEGTQATLLDVIKADAKLVDADMPSDVDEIQNYIKAMNYGMERLKTLPLSLRLIRELHEKLLAGVRGQHRNPGEFRKSQNWIGGPTIATATFVPPPPYEMNQALNELEKFIHESTSKLPLLIKAALIHAQFETIHPFLDGNGRTGRLLITFYLYKAGILPRPLLYISDFFHKNRRDYYDKLNSYRFDLGVEGWLMFFLEGIRTVSNQAVTKAKKITELREEDIKKVSTFGKNADSALILLNKMYALPVVDTKLVSIMTKISSKANVNDLIEKFVKAGILEEITGKQRNRRFIYRKYIEQFTDIEIL
ncbi:MAG: Fic family protein [Candidatus Levybacteria bacterium]|nr:Fic family protein [Candidatus Levybacteria bacterium]